MNADWHRAHVLGQHAALEDRIAWHAEHARECACRPVPDSLVEAVAAWSASSQGSEADAVQIVRGNTTP